ncbi:unnamed protein product [Boreogadus saida]
MRLKKLKSLEVEAAKCSKLTDLFGAGVTTPACAAAPEDEWRHIWAGLPRSGCHDDSKGFRGDERRFWGKKSKISASRRLTLKIKLLKWAGVMLENEKEEKIREREATLKERVPPLQLSGLSVQDLQALCREMNQKIDSADEDRYDIDMKVTKNDKEIENLSQKITDLKGRNRPALKRVKISAEAMLGALLGTKVKESVDFKAALKTVKKEDEKKEEVTDWRKNVEAMSGMEGRKKQFDA